MPDFKIDDRIWRKIKALLKKAESAHVKVGVIGAAANERNADGFSMIELAAVHEFGSPANNIPERSFIRRTFVVKESELKAITAKLAGQVVQNKLRIDQALQILGEWGAVEIKNFVTQTDTLKHEEPLKTATANRKGSDRPLVDTGQMINSISYEVVP